MIAHKVNTWVANSGDSLESYLKDLLEPYLASICHIPKHCAAAATVETGCAIGYMFAGDEQQPHFVSVGRRKYVPTMIPSWRDIGPPGSPGAFGANGPVFGKGPHTSFTLLHLTSHSEELVFETSGPQEKTWLNMGNLFYRLLGTKIIDCAIDGIWSLNNKS